MTNDTKKFTVENIEAAADAWAPYRDYLDDAAPIAFADYKRLLTQAVDEAVAARQPGDAHSMKDATTLRHEIGINNFYSVETFDIDPDTCTIVARDYDGDRAATLTFREVLVAELRQRRAYQVVMDAEAKRRGQTRRLDAEQKQRDLAQLARLKELYPDA